MADIFLLPGSYHFTGKGMTIETLVGSCVTVCLYNIKNGQAAMNHFLHDVPKGKSFYDIGKYGSSSTEYIIEGLMELDPLASHYKAQIFGGAAIIKVGSNDQIVGQKNIEIAKKILNNYRISIIRQEIGGNKGRRVSFDTSTNSVFCRFAGQIDRKISHQEVVGSL
jgi:chemotaxis protein CheD